MKLKVDKEKLASKAWNSKAAMEVVKDQYLEVYGKLLDLDESLEVAKAHATQTAEGKTASIRSAWVTLKIAHLLAERAKTKAEVDNKNRSYDTLRLYHRVISSVLSASGGEPLLYPIDDEIPDPVKQIEHAYTALQQADEELAKATNEYYMADLTFKLKKAQKIAAGVPGKNEEERKANLTLDSEIRDASEDLKRTKFEHEQAIANRNSARDNLRFWLTYMRSLGLDEALTTDPNGIVRQ